MRALTLMAFVMAAQINGISRLNQTHTKKCSSHSINSTFTGYDVHVPEHAYTAGPHLTEGFQNAFFGKRISPKIPDFDSREETEGSLRVTRSTDGPFDHRNNHERPTTKAQGLGTTFMNMFGIKQGPVKRWRKGKELI